MFKIHKIYQKKDKIPIWLYNLKGFFIFMIIKWILL